jgi:hypothetical protein
MLEAAVYPGRLLPSVSMCDTSSRTTFKNPSNHVAMDNEDCAKVVQSFIIHDMVCF